MISDILAPTIDGDRLTEREFKNFFVLLVSAGNDTTRYTMAAGMKALIERPDQLAEFRDSVIAGDTALMESAVEEILRWGNGHDALPAHGDRRRHPPRPADQAR